MRTLLSVTALVGLLCTGNVAAASYYRTSDGYYGSYYNGYSNTYNSGYRYDRRDTQYRAFSNPQTQTEQHVCLYRNSSGECMVEQFYTEDPTPARYRGYSSNYERYGRNQQYCDDDDDDDDCDRYDDWYDDCVDRNGTDDYDCRYDRRYDRRYDDDYYYDDWDY